MPQPLDDYVDQVGLPKLIAGHQLDVLICIPSEHLIFLFGRLYLLVSIIKNKLWLAFRKRVSLNMKLHHPHIPATR